MSDNRTTNALLVALIVGVAYVGYKHQHPGSSFLPNVAPMPAFVPRRTQPADYEISEDPRHKDRPLSGRLQRQEQQQAPQQQAPQQSRSAFIDPEDAMMSCISFKKTVPSFK